jgi:cytochrome b involved in lipid metabolism
MGGFVDEHPGGAKILKRVGGKDASKQFWKVSEARTIVREQRHMTVPQYTTALVW